MSDVALAVLAPLLCAHTPGACDACTEKAHDALEHVAVRWGADITRYREATR